MFSKLTTYHVRHIAQCLAVCIAQAIVIGGCVHAAGPGAREAVAWPILFLGCRRKINALHHGAFVTAVRSVEHNCFAAWCVTAVWQTGCILACLHLTAVKVGSNETLSLSTPRRHAALH